MDNDDFRKFRAVMIAGLLFLISCWKMIGETKYLLRGKRAEATIDSAEAKETSSRRSGRRTVLKVGFHYTDESTGQPAQGNLTVDPDLKWTPGRTFSVQYLPGTAGSAREGVEYLMVTIFFASLIWVSWSLYSMHREANAPIATSRNTRMPMKSKR